MISIDFEFNKTNQEFVDLVSCATSLDGAPAIKWWLRFDPDAKEMLKQYLLQHKDEIMLGFSCVAEGRSFLSLGLDPVQFKWIDLFLEWRCLTNHNHNMMYGNQLVDGKVKFTVPPKSKWDRVEGEKQNSFKLKHSLAEMTYKLTKEIRDTKHKDAMRDLIISDPDEFTQEEQDQILGYNAEDVVFLPKMLDAAINEYKRLLGKDFNMDELIQEMLLRGEYAALTSIRESKGYPINYQATKNFSESVDNILRDCQREINSFFPEIMPFRWDRAHGKFAWNQTATKNWLIKNVDTKRWMKTEKNQLSLALEAFQQVFDYKHSYPQDSFPAQIIRYLVLKQNLNGFKTKVAEGKKNFWDYVGPDQRVRPYMNIYGAQSSRSQPAATGFMHLKPAWLRVLVEPPKGKAMCSIDYGSEEFFLSALLSGDPAMISAYLSGDVYFYFAKEAGAVPQDALREDHEPVRDLFKATVLGISYLMSKYGLATKLTADTGIEHDPDQAQEMIDKFYTVFNVFDEWQVDLINSYQEGNYIKLPCGWYMWTDNDNFRSSANCPIQGAGASIMRKADKLAYDKGLYVPFTLHDALTIEYDLEDFSAIDKLYDSMRDAFIHYAPADKKDIAAKVKMDFTVWSPEYEDGKVIYTPAGHKIKLQSKYIDKRAKRYYDQYKIYFETPAKEFL